MTTLRACLLAALAAVAPACKSELVCPKGKVACNGHCISVLSDTANCGACGFACGSGATCQGGACACPADLATCAGGCAALTSDPDHCGTCGTACPNTGVCSAGACSTSCTAGLTACDRACVDVATDRLHCGSCGTRCGPGQTCRAGACRVDVLVACYATNEVVALAPDLTSTGTAWSVPAGPTALALAGAQALSANGYPAAGVSYLPFAAGAPVHTTGLPQTDLQAVAVHQGMALVSNAGTGSLTVLDPDGLVVDDIPLGNVQAGINPHGIAVLDERAYVALYGTGNADPAQIAGQAIAVVDLSRLSACRLADPNGASCSASSPCGVDQNCVGGRCRPRCGGLAYTVDVQAIAGSHDGAGLAFPSGAVVFGTRVLVSLSNLEYGTAGGFSGWIHPAGNGRLLVIDHPQRTTSIVDLGASCMNPGALALDGTTLWVACGSYSFPAEAPGALVPVSLVDEPSVGPAIRAPGSLLPGRLAFCGGSGYVTDQGSGAVVAFDPKSRTLGSPVEVCPTGAFGFAWAADVACAP